MKPGLLMLVVAVGFHCSSAALAQDRAEDHCLHGCPKGAAASNTDIARSIYALSNNPHTKLADWVAYRVRKQNVDCPTKVRRNWKQDPALKRSETLEPKDYKDSNVTLHVDRGHQAPLASFKCHSKWRETNYLSNTTPQFSKLNQGPWKNLEEAVRRLARTGIDVWVVTGPLFEWPMARLPATDKLHRVPSSYWKIIAVEKEGPIKAAAFYFYQDTPRRANFCDHVRGVDFIEAKSGLDFFADFEQQDTLEASQATLDLGC